jgi:hypothetical protein
MYENVDFNDLEEQRLFLYHQRVVASLVRKEASEKSVRNALSITQDARLARVALEFRLDEYENDPHRWPLREGLGQAIEIYVSSLRQMENVRRSHSSKHGVTNEHRKALGAVMSSADALSELGWPVNWEQNVQAILELTEFGLGNGELVHRHDNLPETVTLRQGMLRQGSMTVYRQKRLDDRVTRFKAVTLSELSKTRYDEILLHRCRDDEDLPPLFQYCSDWLDDGFSRIAI